MILFGMTHYLRSQIPTIPRGLDKAEMIDSMIYEITYSVDIVNDPQEPKKLEHDVQILQIGTQLSKTYSKLLYLADSTATALGKKGAKKIPIFQGLVSPVIIYKNFPNGKYTTVYRTFFDAPILEYEENIPEITWNLQTEKKTLLGYVCQRATTIFRGRNYEAWFAPEIPFKDGPYKFHGLPGLILQLSDDRQNYVYSCIGIKKAKEPVLFWKWEMQKSTKKDVDKLVKGMYQSPVDFMTSTTGITPFYVGKSAEEAKKISYPYNPIELE
jgi:GLPGLI family protein